MSLRHCCLLVSLVLLGIESVPAAQTVFPLSELKPGMVGIGRTVFEGDRIEEFTVRILGVLKNVLAPKRDLVLAKLEGGPLSETGVIAGMSGSPVYIDGRLLGAVSYSLGSFSKEPIAGITPIEEMIEAASLDSPRRQAGRVDLEHLRTQEGLQASVQQAFASLRSLANPSPSRLDVDASIPGLTATTAARLRPIAIPLTLGGFTASSIEPLIDGFRDAGFIPQASAQAQSAVVSKTVLRPGDPIGVSLLTGDLEIGATGTVTHVDEDKVYAFGHPFYNLGPTKFPMTRARVHTILPSLDSSMKIASTGEVIGTVHQDRATTVAGRLGPGPALIPVTLSLASERGLRKTFRMGVVEDQLFTPLMTYLSVVETLGSWGRQTGSATFVVRGVTTLEGNREIAFDDLFTGEQAVAGVGASVMAPINALMRNTFEEARIQSVRLEVEASEDTRSATLERVWVDAIEPEPGSVVPLKVLFKNYRGEEVTREISIRIPAQARGQVSVMVSDGSQLSRWEAREFQLQPQLTGGLPQMIRVLNDTRRNNRLYVRLFQASRGAVVKGEALSSLPSSVLEVVEADRSSGGATPLSSALLGEWEIPTGHAVVGSRTLTLSFD